MKKEKRWLPLKEILFSYLALSKVLYWLDIIDRAEEGDFWNAAEAMWVRLIDRDILLIAIVILFILLEKLILEKSKDGSVLRQVILYAVGFVGVIGLLYMHLWILSWFFPVRIPPLLELVANSIVGYILVVIALNIKIYFKTKEKETYKADPPVQDTDNTLAMLKALLDRGVLTQEEFDRKKEKLLRLS